MLRQSPTASEKEVSWNPLPSNATFGAELGVDMNEDDDTLSLSKVINSAEYLSVDDDAPWFTENNRLKDDIIEAIVNERSCAEDGLRDDDFDDESDQEPAVTHTAARHAVQLLEHYFIEEGFCEMFVTALDTCSNAEGEKPFLNKYKANHLLLFPPFN